MRKYIICVFTLLIGMLVEGQITNGGKPESWKSNSKISSENDLIPVIMPDFDLKKLQAEDAENDKDPSKVFRFGHEFKVDLGLHNAGLWSELPNGDRIWRIHIISNNAKTLNFVFNSYKLPKGASVYLYNRRKTFVLGAYTDKMNNPDESIGTWLADGGNIIIEYYEPKSVKGLGKFNIGSVVHGYRSLGNFEAYQKALNDSGNCNLDVNCSVGSDFDTLKERLKKSVGMTVVGNSGFCTGALINNTSNNKAPYFLTANHCGIANSNWAFRFNWISTNTVCASSANSVSNGSGNYYQTTSGATSRAANRKSDMQLVEITGGLDASWDLEWAGWDRTGNTPSFVVGIHHPSGDIMKVCRESNAPRKVITDFNGESRAEMWEIQDLFGGWELGVTEPGSSGSPLFDPNGRIIGKLSGGTAACTNNGNGTNNNGGFDIYGRFDVSWNFGTTNATRLSNWLDPENTGRTTLDMLSQEIELGVADNILKAETGMYPNPSNGVFNVSNKKRYTLSYVIFDISGQKVKEGRITQEKERIDASSIGNGVYFMSVINTINNAEFTRKIVISR